MYVPEKLKLNKFRLVAIPKPADMFARFGYQVPSSEMFSGDDQVVPSPGRKADYLADLDVYDKMMQDSESSKDSKLESSPSDHYQK